MQPGEHVVNHSWHKQQETYSHADKIIMVFTTCLYLGVVLFLAISNDNLFNVLLGTLPTLIYLIINYSYLKQMERKHLLVWLLPIPLIIAFAAVASAQISLVQNIDWQTLTVLNVFLCYIFAAMIVFVGSPPKKSPHPPKKRVLKKKVQQQVEQQVVMQKTETAITQETFWENLKTIEDKCKAINFVIGRVYSNKRGGSLKQREKIKFNRKWYNLFSEITQDFDDARKQELAIVIQRILERLSILKKQEKEVLDLKEDTLMNLEHNKEGNDVILDVLKKNDSDPVESYYNSVLEVAEAVLKYLKS